METTTETTYCVSCVQDTSGTDELNTIHGVVCGDCVIRIRRSWDEGYSDFARSWTETPRAYGKRVALAIEGWSDAQAAKGARLISNWAGATDMMFWAQQFGQPITPEMRAAAFDAGEAIMNA